MSSRFRAVCERPGFAEDFDAPTWVGLRDRAYTWTAAVDLLVSHTHARQEKPAQWVGPLGRPGGLT